MDAPLFFPIWSPNLSQHTTATGTRIAPADMLSQQQQQREMRKIEREQGGCDDEHLIAKGICFCDNAPCSSDHCHA